MLHDAEAVVEKYPAGGVRQFWAPALIWYRPDVQAVQAVRAPFSNVPQGQMVQRDAEFAPVVAQMYPAPQNVQPPVSDEMPEVDVYLPALHVMQLVRAFSYLPAAHGVQLACPTAAVTVPASQYEHIDAPAAE